jgi:hypothetical protein
LKYPQKFRKLGGNHRCYCNQRFAPTSHEVFLDSESFMADLKDNELGDVNGGITLT